MRVAPLIFLVTCVGAMLLACGGWQLRGVGKDTIEGEIIYLRVGSAPKIQRELARELRNRGGVIVDTASDSELLVTVNGERFERRLLSVDPDTGKVREIELTLQKSKMEVDQNVSVILLTIIRYTK